LYKIRPLAPDGVEGLGTPIPSDADWVGAVTSTITQVIYGRKTVTVNGQTGNTSVTTIPMKTLNS
jgi:hypothetical protein